MDLMTILLNSLWAGLFAGGLGILLTAPPRCIAPALLCGFVGRLCRDLLTTWGMTLNWSTMIAAAVVVLVAVAFTRRHVAAVNVVLVTGVLPLGASVAMFNLIVGLMKVSTFEGDALNAASVALSASAGKVFITSLAIAFGLAAGLAIVRSLNLREIRNGA